VEHTQTPEVCYFKQTLKLPEGCPYEKLEEHPGLAKVYGFVARVLEEYEVADETDIKKKNKKKRYSMSIEKFTHWSDLFMIPHEDRLEASVWCGVAVKAANEAQDIAMIMERQKRWGHKRK
jgi:hypothetical protein